MGHSVAEAQAEQVGAGEVGGELGVLGLVEREREVDAAVRTLQAAPERATPYIRKIPKVVSGIGALSAAEIPSAITLRVSTGSTIPSSQSRAVE